MDTDQSRAYKSKIIILMIAIVSLVGFFAWSNLHHRNIDNLPSLTQISEMEDEAELNSCIVNFTKQDLITVWGNPDESSRMEDIWYLNGETMLVVNYHNNDDHAVVCSIVRES